MGKQEFLTRLGKALSGLPREDIEERLNFYSEMIEDRMEEGLSEEEAVAAAGSAEAIAAQVIAETPLVKIAKERARSKRRLNAWEIVLLALGSPLWLSLGIAAAAFILSLYISVWAVILSLWSVFAASAVCLLGGAAAGIMLVCNGCTPSGIALIAAGLVCGGLSIFLFFGCKAATKGILILTKLFALWIKNRLIRKEEA